MWMLMQVSLATDFVWNLNSREATASFGYDYMLRQCRLRGRIDSDGKVRTHHCMAIFFSPINTTSTTKRVACH